MTPRAVNDGRLEDGIDEDVIRDEVGGSGSVETGREVAARPQRVHAAVQSTAARRHAHHHVLAALICT